jgi:hypothetical protein
VQEDPGQADGPSLMALYLRRAADQFPRAGWEPSNEHLAIISGETCVGTLVRQVGGTLGNWSITCETTPMIGYAETREEAQAQFAEAWRAWLKNAGLQEVE